MRTLKIQSALLTLVIVFFAQWTSLVAQDKADPKVVNNGQFADIKPQEGVKPQPQVVINSIPDQAILAGPFSDLAYTDIRFTVVRAITQHTAVIRIDATMKNLSRVPFVTNNALQNMQLYEDHGGSIRLLRATQTFQNVSLSDTKVISYTFEWTKGTEFPPTFYVILNFNGNNAYDRRANNEDSNSTNNSMRLDAERINSIKW